MNLSTVFTGSWKTTSAGILAIIGGINIIIFAPSITSEIVTSAATAILLGVGLLFARDNNKTSEQVGALVHDTPAETLTKKEEKANA